MSKTLNRPSQEVQLTVLERLQQQALLRLEALLFSSPQPLPQAVLKQALAELLTEAADYSQDPDSGSDRVRTVQQWFNVWLEALAERYAESAVELLQSASGYRLQVRAEFASLIGSVWPERPQKLSQALLETLAVIAYHQPVTRADIEKLRGVSLNSQILRQLFERQWIQEQGVREVPGRPALLVTTARFLDAFGLTALQQLPSLETMPPLVMADRITAVSALLSTEDAETATITTDAVRPLSQDAL